MDEEAWKRLRGFKRLIHDGVKRGTDFVEKHHRHAAAKPFEVLESIKAIAAPTRVVRSVHDGVLWMTYGSIRAINHAVGTADDWLVDMLAPADAGDDQYHPNVVVELDATFFLWRDTGLLDGLGTPRPALSAWRQWRRGGGIRQP